MAAVCPLRPAIAGLIYFRRDSNFSISTIMKIVRRKGFLLTVHNNICLIHCLFSHEKKFRQIYSKETKCNKQTKEIEVLYEAVKHRINNRYYNTGTLTEKANHKKAFEGKIDNE